MSVVYFQNRFAFGNPTAGIDFMPTTFSRVLYFAGPGLDPIRNPGRFDRPIEVDLVPIVDATAYTGPGDRLLMSP